MAILRKLEDYQCFRIKPTRVSFVKNVKESSLKNINLRSSVLSL